MITLVTIDKDQTISKYHFSRCKILSKILYFDYKIKIVNFAKKNKKFQVQRFCQKLELMVCASKGKHCVVKKIDIILSVSGALAPPPPIPT